MKRKIATGLTAVLIGSAVFAPSAFAFGHTAVPAGDLAESDQAVDNPTAEANNTFSDTDPIPVP